MSADQFLRVGAAMHAAARGGLRRREVTTMVATAKRRRPQVAARLAAVMPGTELPGKALKVRQNVTARRDGVRVNVPTGRAGSGLSHSNAALVDAVGDIRHPVFPPPTKARSQWNWVSQGVGGVGWFEHGWTAQGSEFRRGLERAIDDTLDFIANAGR